MQLLLPINTEFELATAEQLAWQRGCDDVNEDDLKLAEKMVARWNKIRIARKQKPIN